VEKIANQRCFNHSDREAAARCPECHRYYCRECVTEHNNRVICASCLKRQDQPQPVKRKSFSGLAGLVQCLMGALVVWLFFYCLGQALLSLPTSFHEGMVWQLEESSER